MTNPVQLPSKLIEAFWIEKYLTFNQTHLGELIPTDHMFLAEYVLRKQASDADLFVAKFFSLDSDTPVATYTGDDPLWCNRQWVNRKVRSFDSLAELEAAHPATNSYRWEVEGSHVAGKIAPMRIGGPEARTQIPRPHPVRLFQSGHELKDLDAVEATRPLTIEWEKFEGGRSGPVIDDVVFVFVDDCRGDVVYFGGIPSEPEYTTFRSTSATVTAGTLRPGEPYTIFFSQCKIVDQDGSDGLINVAVNSFGVELDIHTLGTHAGEPCPEPRRMAPFRWKRKTRAIAGLETWPTIVDN